MTKYIESFKEIIVDLSNNGQNRIHGTLNYLTPNEFEKAN